MQIKAQLASTGGNTTGFVIPYDVVAALGAGRKPAVSATVGLAYSRRRGIVEDIEGAKTDATRTRRVAKAVERLLADSA